MKYFTRSKLYKASNVTFSPELIQATSYDWWMFVKVINGLVVFNDYNYSPTTNKHQHKVRRLMQELGIKIDLVVKSYIGLHDAGWLESALLNYGQQIEKLIAAKIKGRPAKNVERDIEIGILSKKQLELIKFSTIGRVA